MRTEKLCLRDPYTTTFHASLVACRRDALGRPTAILDETYFYPDSGGQPSDRGTIAGIQVVDVQEDDAGTVHHALADRVGPGPVACEIDWARRFDHMQQHTGQHVLSRAFIEVGGLETASFHLGEDVCTIDLEGGKLDDDTLGAAEELANSVIWDDREVRVVMTTPEELDAAALRKSPPDGVGEIRLVEIDGFDTNPCCGTHVRRTGELGMIKVLRYEKAKGAYRVSFEVGRRAYRDFVVKHEIVKRLAGGFTTGIENIEDNVEKLRAENRRLKKDSQKMGKQLAAQEAERLYGGGRRLGTMVFVVERLTDVNEDFVRLLASCLKSKRDTVSILGTDDGLVVCNAPGDSGIDFSRAVVDRAKALGGSGGGKGAFATVRLPASVPVADFLEKVFEDVKDL